MSKLLKECKHFSDYFTNISISFAVIINYVIITVVTEIIINNGDCHSNNRHKSEDCNSNYIRVKIMLQPTVQSVSPSWNKAPIWGLRPDLYYCQTVAGLLMWGALSDERTGLSFARLQYYQSRIISNNIITPLQY
jgi:hypothetical protein